jgi:hypothetical protein
MQSIGDVQSQRYYRKMPFSVNNIDASVTANALYGIASYVFESKAAMDAFDAEMQDLFLFNAKLLAWIITDRVVIKHNSLALLYYPPKYAFYWFAARLYSLLTEHLLSPGSTPAPVCFIEARHVLMMALKQQGTADLLQLGSTDDGLFTYWDDFLGNGDKNKDGSVHRRYEDRVFSTAMTVNALIDIWSVKSRPEKNGRSQLKWEKDTPMRVRNTIATAVSWLVSEAQSYPKDNAFFSGSIKLGAATPLYFPHNSFRWMNGTSAGQCSNYSNSLELGADGIFNLVVSMTGVISESEYLEKIDRQTCFGQKVPKALFELDLNCDGCVFPYWSSPVLTEAMELLALVKYQSLLRSDGLK